MTDGGNSRGCAWGDFDNDGFLDLFVANGGISDIARPNLLYHNNGNGTFTKITSGSVVTDSKVSFAGVWGDYDNDGYVDLFVGNNGGGVNALYRNNGNSTFTTITSGSIVTDGGASVPCAWADYNNDGFLDLFVGNESGINYLYRNRADGTFVKVTGSVVNAGATSVGCAWGD